METENANRVFDAETDASASGELLGVQGHQFCGEPMHDSTDTVVADDPVGGLEHFMANRPEWAEPQLRSITDLIYVESADGIKHKPSTSVPICMLKV